MVDPWFSLSGFNFQIKQHYGEHVAWKLAEDLADSGQHGLGTFMSTGGMLSGCGMRHNGI